MDNIRVKYLVRLKTEIPHSRLQYKMAKSILENNTNAPFIKSIRNIVDDKGNNFIVKGEIPNSKQLLPNFKKTGREIKDLLLLYFKFKNSRISKVALH